MDCSDDAVVELAAQLRKLQGRLAEDSISWSDFVCIFNDALLTAQMRAPNDGEGSHPLFHLAKDAHTGLLNCEVPELLYAALDAWPSKGQRSDALVLLVQAQLVLSQKLTYRLSRKWVWLEVGIIDDEGIDVVPRVCCPVLRHDEPSSTVVVQHRLDHSGRKESHLLEGLAQHLLAGNSDCRLAVWARADGPILYCSSLEVQSVTLELICASPTGMPPCPGAGSPAAPLYATSVAGSECCEAPPV